MLRKPSLQVALSFYMSIGLLAACAPGPNDMAGSESLSNMAAAGSVEARAQAALASFHEVDGSFSDTLQLASLAVNQRPAAKPERPAVDQLDADDADREGAAPAPAADKSEVSRPGLFNELFQHLTSGEKQASMALAEQPETEDPDDADIAQGVLPAATARPEPAPAEDKALSFEPAASLAQMNTLASAMRETLIQKGHVSIAADGSFEVDDDALQSDLQAQQLANPVLDDLEALGPGPLMPQVAPERLMRLGQNGIEALAAPLAPLTLDGRVLNRFAASYRAESLERDVLISRPESGESGESGFDAVLDERSDAFTRHAIRSAEPQADGSLRVITSLTVHLYSGERLDLFEERFVTASGNGVGHGSLRLLGVNGQGVSTGELRTLSNADGSLTTHLDLDEGEDLLLYEDASGRAGLASLAPGQPHGYGIDLNALMQAGLNQGVDFRTLARSEPETPQAADEQDD